MLIVYFLFLSMVKNFIGLHIVNFLIYLSLYPIFGMVSAIVTELFNVDKKTYSIIIMVSLVQLPSSFLLTRLADKTKYHRSIIIFSLLTYVISISAEAFLQKIWPSRNITIRVMVAMIASYFGLGGILPITDALTLNRLTCLDAVNRYGEFKLVCGFGKLTGYGILALPYISETRMSNIYLSIISSIALLLAMIFYAPEYKDIKENENEDKHNRNQSLKIALLSLINYKFIILLIIIFITGIQRIATGHYTPILLKKLNISTELINRYYMVQIICEVLTLCINSILEKYIGINYILIISSLISLLRSLIYGFFSFKDSQSYKTHFYLFLAEGSKGIFTAAGSFVGSKLVYDCSNKDNCTLAQGIIYIFHFVLTEIFSAVSGMVLLSSKDSIDDLRKYFQILFYIGLPLFVLLPLFYIINNNQRHIKNNENKT
ncbi:hypothetical protein SLOPH_466 [Spraguea lophii 42_110]|uniref:Major facilitator superfamily associated domain-containing protein n=1 Tax=Spraguea lophii (strain 42_110) TaxID=1358809 RepID=S7W6B3_SPRLO|nr:hypothetical protein SLOPH_466 [Spraguea lophii 42_110]